METEVSDGDFDEEEFFFESDHLALRGNSDYTAILRAITILQAQKIQALKDIEKIASNEKSALDDPEEFVQKLKSGTVEEMPGPISIIDLPKINFDKYKIQAPEYLIDKVTTIENPDTSATATTRNRQLDTSKSIAPNRFWTCEEQLRLEELLIEYPPEPIEMRRFAKIARALGNRTTKQVASRCQKFFQKLYSAGMPIPGRIPKTKSHYISKATRLIKQALRPTTFFPANYVPVTMTDDDDLNGDENTMFLDPNSYRQAWMSKNLGDNFAEPSTYVVDDDSDAETNEDVKINQRIVKLLQRIKKDKELDSQSDRPASEHNGYKCDLCSEEPIVGTRWHCKTCIDSSIDFCSDCIVSQIQTQRPHPIEHKIIGLRVISEPIASLSAVQSEMDSDVDEDLNSDDTSKANSEQHSVMDQDYLKNSNYNYLDPNFLPH